jgi:phytanoyl-CoA hydroxylase
MSTASRPVHATPSDIRFQPDPAFPLIAPHQLPAIPASAGEPGLNAAQLEHFHTRGWVVVRGLADAATIAALEQECAGLHERMAEPDAARVHDVHIAWEEAEDPAQPRRIRQLMHAQHVCPTIDALSRSEDMLAIMRQLIGPDVYLFHAKLMMKAAHAGSFTPWHQDFQYWQHESLLPTQVNCMLYIDGADLDNGCLRMVDGSNRGGLLPIHRMASTSFSLGLAGGLDDWDSTAIPVQPGDAIIFGSYVIHGSGPNSSDRDRRANTFAFDRPGNARPAADGSGGALPLELHRCGRTDPRSR